jgi:predicted RNA-binding protein
MKTAGFLFQPAFPVSGQENIVCDLKAYVKKNEKEELLLDSVNQVRAEGEEVVLRNLFGEEKRVRGVLREVSLVKNRLIVEQT